MSMKVYSENQKKFARFSKALGHPVRLFILQYLQKQSCCYSGDLSEILPIAKSTLSQHLTELKKAGLIHGEIEPPKVRYCINPTAWDECRDLFESMFKKEIVSANECC